MTPPVMPPVTPPPAKAKSSRSWRIFFSPTIDFDFGFIPKDTITELGAYTTNDGWGRAMPVFSTEVGLIFLHNQRVTVGLRQTSIVYRESMEVDGENKQSQRQFFGRYARYFFNQEDIRPYLGAGGLGGHMRFLVDTSEENNSGSIRDSYKMFGLFFNGFAGLRFCLWDSCPVAFQMEANLLWKVADPEGEDFVSKEHFKTVVLWLTMGLSLAF